MYSMPSSRSGVASCRTRPLIGNAGSFFKNPIVPRATRDQLREKFPSLVSYDIGGGRCKLAAGWLIDACG